MSGTGPEPLTRSLSTWRRRSHHSNGSLAVVPKHVAHPALWGLERPGRSPSRLPQQRVRAIEALRRLRMTASEIAEVLGIALSTVSLWLRRIGLGKGSRLEPPELPNRYERRHPGELVHVEIKQLGRISERGAGDRVLGHRASQYTRRPRTNGKAKRLIRTLLNEWAYAHIYGTSPERAAALDSYLERYNYRRHGSLSHQPPAARLKTTSLGTTTRQPWIGTRRVCRRSAARRVSRRVGPGSASSASSLGS
jgi:Integrase core domain/Homeodomain-like domain